MTAAKVLHGAAVSLPPGAPLWIYGNADEGMNGIDPSEIAALFLGVTTLCRGDQGQQQKA